MVYRQLAHVQEMIGYGSDQENLGCVLLLTKLVCNPFPLPKIFMSCHLERSASRNYRSLYLLSAESKDPDAVCFTTLLQGVLTKMHGWNSFSGLVVINIHGILRLASLLRRSCSLRMTI